MIDSMTVEELKKRMEEGNSLTLVDCRELNEWNAQHIEDALHLPLSELGEGMKSLGGEKSRPIVFHCRSGKRSLRACQMLSDEGFENLYNLEGGILAWMGEGYKVVASE